MFNYFYIRRRGLVKIHFAKTVSSWLVLEPPWLRKDEFCPDITLRWLWDWLCPKKHDKPNKTLAHSLGALITSDITIRASDLYRSGQKKIQSNFVIEIKCLEKLNYLGSICFWREECEPSEPTNIPSFNCFGNEGRGAPPYAVLRPWRERVVHIFVQHRRWKGGGRAGTRCL